MTLFDTTTKTTLQIPIPNKTKQNKTKKKRL